MCVAVCSTAPLLFGDTSTNECVSHCPSGSFSFVNASMLCVSQCPSTYYGDPLSR